ncbi:hypothetical protein DdX_03816 [Ditylenchus destructor]|uniref:Uncharacterized protein n=1 Tax=Ditylenchus destructor TaxID=166010 RepID=A0AAD4NFN2_9BILA|nr:hypothetical protein DdX_03816 [Ditylenchus destructor]
MRNKLFNFHLGPKPLRIFLLLTAFIIQFETITLSPLPIDYKVSKSNFPIYETAPDSLPQEIKHNAQPTVGPLPSEENLSQEQSVGSQKISPDNFQSDVSGLEIENATTTSRPISFVSEELFELRTVQPLCKQNEELNSTTIVY